MHEIGNMGELPDYDIGGELATRPTAKDRLGRVAKAGAKVVHIASAIDAGVRIGLAVTTLVGGMYTASPNTHPNTASNTNSASTSIEVNNNVDNSMPVTDTVTNTNDAESSNTTNDVTGNEQVSVGN